MTQIQMSRIVVAKACSGGLKLLPLASVRISNWFRYSFGYTNPDEQENHLAKVTC